MRLTPAEALTAATINAAAAIGLDKKVGSLERGKRADVLVMDVNSVSQIPYRFGTNLCSVVMKDGKVVWRKHMHGSRSRASPTRASRRGE
jgi:imidazolonepropionase